MSDTYRVISYATLRFMSDTYRVISYAYWIHVQHPYMKYLCYIGMLFNNSPDAIYLGKNLTFHARAKHIDIYYHFIHSLLENKEFLEKIHLKSQSWTYVDESCSVR